MPNTRRRSEFLVNLGISIAVAVLVLLFTQNILFDFPPLERAELSLIDWRFEQRGPLLLKAEASPVVIVEISEESFLSLPEPWPWPKSYYARLVRNLHRAGARAIGIDVLFSSPDRRNPESDEDFRRALRETGAVVLAGKLETEHREYRRREPAKGYGNVFVGPEGRFGLVNTREDVDGIVRRSMPFAYDAEAERRIPMFSFAVLNAYYGLDRDALPGLTPGGFSAYGADIPRYDAASFLINYFGPSGTFRRIKFADVIDDSAFTTVEEESLGEEVNTFDDPDAGYLYDGTFRDKIVIVGSTMPEDKDLFTVPVGEGRQEGDNVMFGVEIHANIIQGILDRNLIARQPLWITVLLVFGLSLFTFVLTAGLKSMRVPYSGALELLGIALILSELFLIYWGALKLFTERNYLADMSGPFLAVLLCYVGSTVYNYLTERRQKVLIKSMFSRYVNPAVVDELVAHPEKLRLGGERRELTVFFSDIERFTGISEQLPPEQLVTVLNEYLSAMTEIIIANNGTLDKYDGDAIVAFWGAPVPQPDHALGACRAALAMRGRLDELRETWQREGKPPLRIRIGINTGEMIVGNMGGTDRFDYTVIGDAVNLGARLEGANKLYRTDVMISESTLRLVAPHVRVRELDLLLVVGKTEPVRVYELIGLAGGEDGSREFLDRFGEGLAYYRERRWEHATEAFTKALALRPDDYPTQVYIERVREYAAAPPPPGWNGVFVLTTK